MQIGSCDLTATLSKGNQRGLAQYFSFDLAIFSDYFE